MISIAKFKLEDLIKPEDLLKKAGEYSYKYFISGIENAENQQVNKISLQSMLGSESAGTALYDYAKTYGAQKSILGIGGTLNATKQFAQFTNNIDIITRLYGLAERLYARDPSQGKEKAVSSVQSLLMGDASAVQNDYQIWGADGNKVNSLMASGDMNGAIDYMLEAFDECGASQEIVLANFESLQTQADKFGEGMQYALGDQSGSVVQGLSAVLQQLNNQLKNGGLNWFFNIIGDGMEWLGNALSWVAENLNTLIKIFRIGAEALMGFAKAMKVAAVATNILKFVFGGVPVKVITLIACLLGAGAGTASILNMEDEANKDSEGSTFKDLDKLKAEAQNGMDESKMKKRPTDLSSSSLHTEITNTAPIAVTGKMEIEKEVLRYQFDLAAQKAMAVFRMQQYVPQVIIQNQNVSQTADLNEINHSLGDIVYQNLQTQPAGVYG